MFPLRLSIFVSLAITPFVACQSDSTALQLQAIQAHFKGAGLVPALLPTFDPSALLDISYAGTGKVSPGKALTRAQVAPTPTLTVTPANSSVLTSGEKYTIAMVDAGPVGTDQSAGQTRHWLVNGATIADSTISNASASVITAYAGPAPPAGSGPHRYVVLLHSQPASFHAPPGLDHAGVAVSVFNFPDYVKSSGLGPLVAANYITVEEGKATVSLSPTSAVVTSTLAVPSSATNTQSTVVSPTKTGSAMITKTKSGWPFILAAPLALVLM